MDTDVFLISPVQVKTRSLLFHLGPAYNTKYTLTIQFSLRLKLNDSKSLKVHYIIIEKVMFC